MRRILIITWSMIPYTDNWGSCQRMFYLADMIQQKKGLVDIVCAYEGVKNSSCKKEENVYAFDVKGNRVEMNYNSPKTDVYENLKKIKNSKIGIVILTIAKIVNVFLNDSNEYRGLKVYVWSKKNYKNIKNLVQKNHYDTIVISGPPHALFLIGKKLKTKNTTVIFDYRDPWNTWRRNSPISEMIEKKVLRNADTIVCTNSNMKNSLMKRMGVNDRKIYVVGNGYSKLRWKNVWKKKINKTREKFIISYIGSINLDNYASFRNCDNIERAYEVFRDRHSNVELEFVGVNDYNDKLKKEYRERGIRIRGKVSVEESLEIMMESDVLMLMHTVDDGSGKYIISAKLYDYIASGKPVIGIGHSYDLHKEIIEKNGIGIFCENDSEQIVDAFESMYQRWISGEESFKKLEKENFSREFQNEIYADILKVGIENA